MHLYFFIAHMYHRAYIYIYWDAYKYVVATGLKIDRHVFTVICPFLRKWPLKYAAGYDISRINNLFRGAYYNGHPITT